MKDSHAPSAAEVEAELCTDPPEGEPAIAQGTDAAIDALIDRAPSEVVPHLEAMRDIVASAREAVRQYQLRMGKELWECQEKLGSVGPGRPKKENCNDCSFLRLSEIGEAFGLSERMVHYLIRAAQAVHDAQAVIDAADGETIDHKGKSVRITSHERAAARRVVDSLQSGKTPINRAKPALAGALFNEAKGGRGACDHARNFQRAVKALRTSMTKDRWRASEGPWDDALDDLLHLLTTDAPEEVLREIRRAVTT